MAPKVTVNFHDYKNLLPVRVITAGETGHTTAFTEELHAISKPVGVLYNIEIEVNFFMVKGPFKDGRPEPVGVFIKLCEVKHAVEPPI